MEENIIEINFEDKPISRKKPHLVITKDDLPASAPSVVQEYRIESSQEIPHGDSLPDYFQDNQKIPFLAWFARNILIQLILACLGGGFLAWLLVKCF